MSLAPVWDQGDPARAEELDLFSTSGGVFSRCKQGRSETPQRVGASVCAQRKAGKEKRAQGQSISAVRDVSQPQQVSVVQALFTHTSH